MLRSTSRTGPWRPGRLAAGLAVAIAVLALIGGVLVAIWAASDAAPSRRIDVVRLVVMTTVQASLTTVLSLVVGMAVAWALNRLRFPGRDAVIAFFASALVTPGLVLAFGLLAVWGRSGWINAATGTLLGAPLVGSIFGLGGILFAHVLLDASLAARVLLGRLDGIPEARLKLGQGLGLGPIRRLVLLDWPAMRGSLPGLAALIFLLAFTSFPIVLLLGGGPANQTLEVAIFSAARLDFDLAGAVRLALVQLVICGTIVLLASAFSPTAVVSEPSRGRHWPEPVATRTLAVLVLGVATAGFGLPLLAVLLQAAHPDLLALAQSQRFLGALASSLAIGATSAALTLVVALAVAGARAALPLGPLRLLLGASAYVYLAVPAVVLSLGIFIAVRRLGLNPDTLAPPLVVLANTLLALPFAVATLGPPLEAIARTRGRLIRSLGLSAAAQWRWVEWPLLGREIGVVLAIAFCFSLGDLGVIAMLGSEDFTTLPLLMYRALGAYRSNDAAIIAALMLALSLVSFFALPRLFGWIARHAGS